MADIWNAGYVTDINYTFGYYQELNPQRAALSLLNSALKPPKIRTACELGFGQGLSIAMHAATQPGTQWYGTDFNPSQAGFAQELASRAGVDAKLFDQSFEEFCVRDDLPSFDFIALHGIWTWISDANREIIVDFVRRKLAVGGVLYISYNVLPGWSPAAPLRHLMKSHSDHLSSPGAGVAQRIDDAFAFMDKLFATNPVYVRNNPQITHRFNGLKDHNRQYLAHEYMNRDWSPMYVAQMQNWLEPAKLSFVTSASFLEQQDAINMSQDQIALLAGLPDYNFRETVRDYITGQQFRRDLWVRGTRKLNGFDQADLMRSQRYVLITFAEDVPMKVKGLQGEVGLLETVYRPIVDFMSDYHIRSFAQMEEGLREKNLTLAQLASAIAILVGMGALSPVQDDKSISKARAPTEKLNQVLMDSARTSGDITFLASPVTGGGVATHRFEQLFLLARASGRKTSAEWAAFAADLLWMQGQKLIKDGIRFETKEENLRELNDRVQLFERRLPIFKALGIA